MASTIFSDYVDSYWDLGNALRNSQDWNQYVDTNSDLLNFYNGLSNEEKASYEQNKGSFPSGKALWGAEHYSRFGASEGRKIPLAAPGGGHVYSKEAWGQVHWDTYGKNEDRILEGPKFSVDRNGNLTLAGTDFIGSQALKGYQKIVDSFNSASEGEFKSLMSSVDNTFNSLELNDLISNGGLDTLSASYQAKITPWDATTGAQPPTGGFDSKYYRTQTEGGKDALAEWNRALNGVTVGGVSIPDLDITGRYNLDSYMHWHYTTTGKASGYRGNKASEAKLSTGYEEYLTDAEYQMYRDQILGIEGDTYLSKAVGTELLAKEKQLQQQFGALTTDSLKAAGDELLEQKKKERDLEFLQNLEGFKEVFSINNMIADSLMGDLNYGGILGFAVNPEDFQESLEKGISGITGINVSNVSYNWEKWFEENLVSEYADGITVTDPLDPTQTYVIDSADFAQKYINEYLTPRFDSSKSMSEFISTLELQQGNENVFQTATAMQELRDIAGIRSQAYLDGIKSQDPLNFDSAFYFNPSGNFSENDPKVEKYAEQTAAVSKDWETAKKKGSTLVPGTDWTWDQWAYHYGLDVNNKDQFAKLHYQVLGASNGYDPAKDLITLKDAEDYIALSILPEIANTGIDIDDITFLQYVTPEEFAKSVIEGIDPERDQEEWDNMMKTLGIEGVGMGIPGVEEYIADAFRTGKSTTIRNSIEYLNQKGKKPTQELLGVDYIERPEDYDPKENPYETTLYKIFKDAGYKGSEDDFYGTFMTDVNQKDIQLLEQASSESGLQLGLGYNKLTSSDPFVSLTAINSLFGLEDDVEAPKGMDLNYLDFLSDDKDAEKYKSETAESILGEFTSLFKGFS